MILVLMFVQHFVPIQSPVRIVNVFIIMLYGLLGSGVYFLYAYQSKLTKNVFGGHFLKSISKIFLRK